MCVAAPVTAATITRGPLQQLVRPGAVTVVVELDEPAAVSVCCGPAAPWDDCYQADAPATRHELDVLRPDAGDLQCFVADEGGASMSEMFPVFAEPSGDEPWTFMIIGDTRTRPEVHRQVVDAMLGIEQARLYVHTGDFVEYGLKLEDWDTYFDNETPLMRRMPMLAVVGNHDLDHLEEGDRGLTVWRDVFALPEDSPAPEAYYSVRQGNVQLIVLDTYNNILPRRRCAFERFGIWEYCLVPEQYGWLLAELEQAASDPDVDHIVVLPHVGPYSSRVGRDGNAQLRALMPVFARYGVTAVVSGHDHYYERGYSWNGVPYIIAAGGGAPLYEIGPPNPAPHVVEYSESTEHFLRVDVDGEEITFTAVGLDGRVVDTLTRRTGQGYERRARPPWLVPAALVTLTVLVLGGLGMAWWRRRRSP